MGQGAWMMSRLACMDVTIEGKRVMGGSRALGEGNWWEGNMGPNHHHVQSQGGR